MHQTKSTAAAEEQQRLEELDGLRTELAATAEKLQCCEQTSASAEENRHSEVNGLNEKIHQLDEERQRLNQMLQQQARVLEDSQTQNTKQLEINTQLSDEMIALKSAIEFEREKLTR